MTRADCPEWERPDRCRHGIYRVLQVVLLLLSAFPATGQPFRRLGYDIPALTNQAMAWADFNGDGRQDLAIAGDIRGSDSAPVRISRLYRNDGDFFTEMPHWLVPVDYAALAWADYDHDGDTDLALAGADGATSTSCLTRIYRNDKGIFSNAGIALPGVRKGTLKWGDYDADGWPDLAIAGQGGNGSFITRIYHNIHGALSDSGARPAGATSLDWGDADGDGDLDMLLSDASAGTRFYRCEAGSFLETGSLPGALQAAWVDHDRDGKTEACLLRGIAQTPPGEFPSVTFDFNLYRFSAGGFSDTHHTLPGRNGPFAWVDIDGDGYPELHTSGQVASTVGVPYYTAIVYHNDRGTTFSGSDAPFIMSAGALQWIDFNGDGRPEPTAMGMIQNYTAYSLSYNNQFALWLNHGGSFTNLSGAFHYGPGTIMHSTWRDLNGNGYPQLFMFGYESGFRYFFFLNHIYRNPTGKLDSLYNPFAELGYSGLAWGDLDGDGDEDLALAAGKQLHLYASTYHLKIYHNDAGTLMPVTTNLPENGYFNLASADFNRDGRWDLALSGSVYDPITHVKSAPITDIYRMDHATSFTALGAGLPMAQYQLAAADYDKDGWPDLALHDDNTTLGTNVIYRNNHGKMAKTAIVLPSLIDGRTEWVDLDGDGDPDLVLTGTDSKGVPLVKLFRNDGAGKFTDLGPKLPNLFLPRFAWGDYNGDGRLDLAAYGFNYAKVYRNNGGNYVEMNLGLADTGPTDWGDYDRDGDLDLIIGKRLYRNDRIVILPPRNGVSGWQHWR